MSTQPAVGGGSFALYAMFWVLLWTPHGWAGRAVKYATVVLTGLSTVVIVAYVPLAVLRLARRDRLSLTLAVLVTATAAVQPSGAGGSGRSGGARLDSVWAVANTGLWAVPISMLGFRATADLVYLPGNTATVAARNAVVILVAWAVVVAVPPVAWLAARRGWVRPNVRLSLLAAGQSRILLWIMIVANGGIAQRYLFPVELLFYAAAAALLTPTATRLPRAVPIAVLVLLVSVTSALNFRWNDTWCAKAPRWSDEVRAAAVTCAADPTLGHVVVCGGPQPCWSIVLVPCHTLRRHTECVPGACVWLDSPRALPTAARTSR